MTGLRHAITSLGAALGAILLFQLAMLLPLWTPKLTVLGAACLVLLWAAVELVWAVVEAHRDGRS